MKGDWRALHRINTAFSFLSRTLGPCVMLNREEERIKGGICMDSVPCLISEWVSCRHSETTECQRVGYPHQRPQRVVK